LEVARLKRRLAASDKKVASLDFYANIKAIGSGSFGKVMLSRHKLTSREVAVKVMDKRKMTATEDKKRVAQEIRILGKLIHPYIIRLYEVIEVKDEICMVMECAAGGALSEHVKKKKRLGESEARALFLQISNGIQYIHSFNYYHRDIKLANILLNAEGMVKICDFGLGVFKGEGKKLSKFCGSPAYMPPEIVNGHDYEGSGVDIWCLGIALYAMVVGECPFKAPSFAALRKKILTGCVSFPEYLSEELIELIGIILVQNPEERATMGEIVECDWCTADPDLMEDLLPPSEYGGTVEVEQEILDRLEGFGFTDEFVIDSLAENKHNHATTCYHLLGSY